MTFSLSRVAAGASLVLFLGAEGFFLRAAVRVDTEDDLKARIEREQDPVKKAKYEIRLAHLKLLRGTEGCQRDDHEVCHQFLGAYLELMQASWKDLESAGRPAVKHSAGFKELDIALREDARSLEDAERKIPIEDRDYIDSVIRDMEKLHEEVMGALFPGGGARSKAKKTAPPGEAHFAAGRAE